MFPSPAGPPTRRHAAPATRTKGVSDGDQTRPHASACRRWKRRTRRLATKVVGEPAPDAGHSTEWPAQWWKRGGVELSRPKQDYRRSTTSVFGDLGSRASGPHRQGPGCASRVVFCASYPAFDAQHPDLVAPCSVRQAETETRYVVFRPRRRAQSPEPVKCCQLLACRRINEGGGILGLQSTNLPLCRNHTLPYKNFVVPQYSRSPLFPPHVFSKPRFCPPALQS